MPSLDDFKKFIDKMEIDDAEKEELLKAFTNNKDNIIAPLGGGAGFDPKAAARKAMASTLFSPGGFSGPSYIYFLIMVAIILVVLGKRYQIFHH